jgi:hypothetical protein
VGARGKTQRRCIAVLACTVIAGTLAGQAAAGTSPKPEKSPTNARIRPQAAPSPQPAPQSGSTAGGASLSNSGSSGTYSPPQTRVPYVPHPVRPIVRHDAGAAKKNQADPPPKVSSKPIRELVVWNQGRELLETSARGLAAPPSSRESLLLLLVGLALVALVLGETTFLRRAARAPARQRVAEEPLPIRRVQLRR